VVSRVSSISRDRDPKPAAEEDVHAERKARKEEDIDVPDAIINLKN